MFTIIYRTCWLIFHVFLAYFHLCSALSTCFLRSSHRFMTMSQLELVRFRILIGLAPCFALGSGNVPIKVLWLKPSFMSKGFCLETKVSNKIWKMKLKYYPSHWLWRTRKRYLTFFASRSSFSSSVRSIRAAQGFREDHGYGDFLLGYLSWTHRQESCVENLTRRKK